MELLIRAVRKADKLIVVDGHLYIIFMVIIDLDIVAHHTALRVLTEDFCSIMFMSRPDYGLEFGELLRSSMHS
jgi:hypothetical protein